MYTAFKLPFKTVQGHGCVIKDLAFGCDCCSCIALNTPMHLGKPSLVKKDGNLLQNECALPDARFWVGNTYKLCNNKINLWVLASHYGCVWLASPSRPHDTHSLSPWQELIERSLTPSWWRHAPRKWPTQQAGQLGLIRVSPWNDVKETGLTQGS